MGLWKSVRIPEPEVMAESDEVESYSSAAAERHLDLIDNTFVEHVLGLLPRARRAGWGLDVGTGPGQIPIKLLCRAPGLKIVGLDRSLPMLARARENAARAGVSGRLGLLAGDGHSLPYGDGTFSLVLSNSMLHHSRDPVRLLRELFRVAAPDAPVLVRDLRRPSQAWMRWHLWRHGRHYQGLMRRLFEDSVRAAYTVAELEVLIREAGLENARPFRFRGAHLGVERKAVG